MKKKVGVYRLKQKMDGVYTISNTAVSMILVVGSEKALLFDTGYGFGDIKAAVREITDKPLVVVNSHGHLDHACGNYQFDEVYLNYKDNEVIKVHHTPKLKRFGLKTPKAFKIFHWLPKGFDEDAYLDRPIGKLLDTKEGDIFDLGDLHVEVYELPGHTPGSIGLLVREKRLLLTSDAINGFLFLWLPESTGLSVYRNTLEKALGIDFDIMMHAHDTRIKPKSVLYEYFDVAKNLDWESGKDSTADILDPGVVYRACRSKNRKNKSQIVITKDRIEK